MLESNQIAPREGLPSSIDRRRFLEGTAILGAAAASCAVFGTGRAAAADLDETSAEKLVGRLYESLTDKQVKMCLLPFEHPLRSKIDANWHITEARIGRHFNSDQQALITDIFRSLHSPEYVESVYDQVEHDGGLKNCSIAMFGNPGSGEYEFVLTGRHVTRRCDGNTVKDAAFGGPIFYGHSAAGQNEPADHPGNAYWYQAKRANQLFQALDGKQRKIALLDIPRKEHGNDTVKLTSDPAKLAGLSVEEMSADQKKLARQVMSDVLAPFRKIDRKEAMKLVDQNGFDRLHFSYYKSVDIGNDGVWDVWQIQGPAMIWHFRGAPHVHTWVNIRTSA